MDSASVATTPMVEKKVKPEKPDEQAFNANLDKVQKEHKALMDQLVSMNSELKAELNRIKATQSSKKSSKMDLLNRQKTLEESMNSKITALNASKAKLPYSSVEAIDAQIAKLEAQVESGTLKLVDERKAVA